MAQSPEAGGEDDDAPAGDADGPVDGAAPPADDPPADEPVADVPPADVPPADDPPVDDPTADDPPADDPVADTGAQDGDSGAPPVEEPNTEAPPAPPTDVAAALADESTDTPVVRVTWKAPTEDADGLDYEVGLLDKPPLTRTDLLAYDVPLGDLDAGTTYQFVVRSVSGTLRSDQVEAEPVTTPSKAATKKMAPWIVALCVVGVFVGLSVGLQLLRHLTGTGQHNVGRFAAAQCGLIVLGIGLALVAMCARGGLLGVVTGADNRVSTSKVQAAVWTVGLAFAFAYISWRTLTTDRALTQLAPNSVVDDYLILLGGPFAALVAAKGVVSAKVADGTLQKTIAEDDDAKLRQALTDDGKNPSLVDSQYLLFNVVAFAYAAIGFVLDDALVAIPGVMLAVTGTAAATYVLNKTVEQNKPSLGSVTPSTVRPGETAVLRGQNLVPDGTKARPVVTVGGIAARVKHPSEGRVEIVVPATLAAGDYEVRLTTPARVTSQPVPVRVIEDKPVLLGLRGGSLRTGSNVLHGSGFRSRLEPDVHRVAVTVGDVTVPGRVSDAAGDLEKVTFEAPLVTDPEVDITVASPLGKPSDPLTVPVAPG